VSEDRSDHEGQGAPKTQIRTALSVKGQREISSAHSRERACEDVGVAGAMLVIAPSPANGLARLGEILYFTIVKLNKSADEFRGKTVRPFSRAHAECEELAPWSSLAPKGDIAPKGDLVERK
jgi:hypothetical protein